MLWIILFLLKINYIFHDFATVNLINTSTGRIDGTLGMLLILLSVSFLLKRNVGRIYLITCDFLMTGLFLVDLISFRCYNDIIGIQTLSTAWRFLQATTNWWAFLKLGDIYLGADLVVLVVIVARKIYFPLPKVKFSLRLVVFLLTLLIGSREAFQAYKLLEIDQPGITNTFYSKLYIAQSVGNLEFRALDVMRSAKIKLNASAPNSQDTLSLAQWLKTNHPSAVTTNNQLLGVAKGKNLIVLQVESLQQFVIGKTINGIEITPNLNRFLQQSLYFENYYGETWNGGTSDAAFMSNASLYPVSKGSAYIDYPMNHYTSIANTLSAKGYQTISIEATPSGFWGSDLMTPALGFKHTIHGDDLVQDETIGMGLADQSMLQQGAEHLEQLKEPFYSMLITLSSHYPFEIPEKDKDINVAPYDNTLFGNYLESVHYTDQAIGNFLDRLAKDGLLEHSVVVIYGDHPAPLGTNNQELAKFLGYGQSAIDDYHWQAMQKVPLIVHLPSGIGHGTISKISGQVDLFPTLLGLWGEDAGQYPVLGHDLLNSAAPGLAISRNGVMYYQDRLYNIPGKAVYDFKTGNPLPWSDSDPALRLYQDYLKNSDLIFQYDLQSKLG
ncbi:MAG: LTA synthase family protein [Desulfosporosinus sp.]|nr:LTA synthase family protein [Desulfosporosinus sp.]